MNIKTGTDIIEIQRVKEMIDDFGEKTLNRIYTQKEITYCESKKNAKYQHYAARFSAKEAVYKAISQYILKTEITWKDIEIITDSEGRPSITLHNEAQKLEQLIKMDISISHCKQYAVAMVIIWEK